MTASHCTLTLNGSAAVASATSSRKGSKSSNTELETAIS